MKKLKEISVIIPIYNESAIILELYERLTKSLSGITNVYELIFVNDGSNDDSIQKIKLLSDKDQNVYYIDFNRNFGHQIAISAGLKQCAGKCVVIIDGDLQDPPELIPELYKEYQKGFEVVYAQRNKRKGETFLKKITAKCFYRILEKITNFTIPFDSGDFRIMDKKVVSELNNMSEQNKFLRGQVAWLGFSHSSVKYDRDSRELGSSGYSYGKMFRLAFDAITGFSDKPLLFVSRMGLIISLLSFCIIIFAVFSYFVLDQTVTGWTSLIISSAFIGGIQLISVGIIGEYIARINKDIKKRPLYIVKETNIASEGDED
ncbi:glycosyltransferase family 2 protein [Seonamhaeicola maritimus]|uniref:glycosyltransferase family 2 protein n=1 Tax=Seonamhaeicola maritimus TaxID=2591822 RepID=UPI002494ED7D|nr:glycosyltransferase family 2 protein [Seonamhaeicola maritimus]